jgi:hypothetical protein
VPFCELRGGGAFEATFAGPAASLVGCCAAFDGSPR